MIRTAVFPAHRPQWLAAALVTLLLAAACGRSKEPVEAPDGVQPPPSSTPVIPASVTVVSEADDPVAVPASYEEAEAVFKAGKFVEAKLLFEGYVASKPDNAWGYYMLGLSSWKSGDRAGAERAFDRALATDPTHLKSLLNSARVLLELGRTQEALDRVQAARELDSTSGEAFRLLARVHDELGDSAAAFSAYRAALLHDERDVWAMNNLGMLHIRQRDFEAALLPLARAVQLRPTAPVFQNNLGIALELTGHPSQALRAYRDALKADSTYAKAIANAKRLGEVVIDSTGSADVNLRDLAERFRQTIRTWKE